MRRTVAEDMENSLIDENPVKNKCINKTRIVICLLTSYGLFYGIGFYAGFYIETHNDDGSNI